MKKAQTQKLRQELIRKLRFIRPFQPRSSPGYKIDSFLKIMKCLCSDSKSRLYRGISNVIVVMYKTNQPFLLNCFACVMALSCKPLLQEFNFPVVQFDALWVLGVLATQKNHFIDYTLVLPSIVIILRSPRVNILLAEQALRTLNAIAGLGSVALRDLFLSLQMVCFITANLSNRLLKPVMRRLNFKLIIKLLHPDLPSVPFNLVEPLLEFLVLEIKTIDFMHRLVPTCRALSVMCFYMSTEEIHLVMAAGLFPRFIVLLKKDCKKLRIYLLATLHRMAQLATRQQVITYINDGIIEALRILILMQPEGTIFNLAGSTILLLFGKCIMTEPGPVVGPIMLSDLESGEESNEES